MKKIMLVLVLTMLLSLMSIPSIASSDEDLIYVSNFRFEDVYGTRNILSSDSKIYAKCDIERIDGDESKSVPYELIMQIRINGKLVSLTSTRGSINVADGIIPLEVEGYIDGDASDCELTAYLFGDVGSLVPLANCAVYGSDTAVLDKITINILPISGFSSDVFNYVCRFDVYPSNIPVLRFYPANLASPVLLSGGFPKTVNYTVSSVDEVNENEYKVEFDIAKNKKTIICEDQKEKRRDATVFKTFDIASTTDYTGSVTAKLSAYINNAAINSSNVSKFATSSYLTFDLSGCDVAKSEPVNLFIRGKVNHGTIHRELNISVYSYNPENTNGNLGEKLDSNNIYSDGIATANAQYYDYTFDVSDYVIGELEKGNTDITLVLTFDDADVVSCWDQLKGNTYPEGIAKDLTFGYVLNTAATRQYNGTSIIYGDGQPSINYYEYVK